MAARAHPPSRPEVPPRRDAGARSRRTARSRAVPQLPAGEARAGMSEAGGAVAVVGGGVIGSLFAGHLAQVCDVSVLCRRAEHAEALRREGLRVSGRHELHAKLEAAVSPAELPEPWLA